MEEGEDSQVMVATKAKMRKVTIVYNSDDSEELKEKTQRKAHLKMAVMTIRNLWPKFNKNLKLTKI